MLFHNCFVPKRSERNESFYETETVSPAKIKDLELFMREWFTNIKNQGFEPETVKTYEQEEEQDYER